MENLLSRLRPLLYSNRLPIFLAIVDLGLKYGKHVGINILFSPDNITRFGNSFFFFLLL